MEVKQKDYNMKNENVIKNAAEDVMKNKIGKPTIKLYDENPYETSFTGRVLSCKEVSLQDEMAYQVILDRTLFFPEEGGQSPDRGTINGIQVETVQLWEGYIVHTLSQPFEEGVMIEGKIDWNYRFSNMQQHSAEHIFSGIVHREYQLNNVGFHLSDSVVTMDFDGPLTREQIQAVEWKVNCAITENVEIDARYPEKEELEKLDYRSKIEIQGPVRIVTIPGYDVCACCAPHVRRTGEIGMFKVMHIQNYKGGVRISILCGFRALIQYREKSRIISGLMQLLSAGQDTLLERVEQMKEANNELKEQLNSLKKETLFGRIRAISPEKTNVILFEDEADMTLLRQGVNLLMENHKGICGMFAGDAVVGYRFILGSTSVDCMHLAAELRKTFGGRCGGSSTMIQGALSASRGEIEHFMELF